MKIILNEQELKLAIREFVAHRKGEDAPLSAITFKIVAPGSNTPPKFESVEIDVGEITPDEAQLADRIRRTPRGVACQPSE